jgi:hypothetical protein
MTQAQLDCAVADATGETLQTIHDLGFSLLTRDQDDLEPAEDLRLVVDCPFCGRPVPCPDRAGDGTPPLAECLRCDVEFPFDGDEVYAAGLEPGRDGPAARDSELG